MNEVPTLTQPWVTDFLPVAAPGAEDAHTWAEAFESLRGALVLGPDWDGQGAAAPVPGVIDTAVRLGEWLEANAAPAPRFAVVGVNGTVYFEWHSASDYTEVEVTGPGRFEVMRYVDDSGAAVCRSFELDPTQANPAPRPPGPA